MMREEIKKLTEKAIKELQKAKRLPKFDIPEIKVEKPEIKEFGDYSTNVAMIIAAKTGRDPAEIAGIISEKIYYNSALESVLWEKPGFINFFLSKEYLQKQVEKVLSGGEKFGELKIGKKKKIDIECICANPTGELHIGHGRGAFLGETLTNVFKKSGFRVFRSHYANDAKSSSQIKELGRTALGRGTTYLNDYLEKKINEIEPKIGKCKNEREAGSLLAQEVQKDIKNFIENKLKIRFDFWVSEEKDLYQTGKINKIYNWLEKQGLVYKKDGAQWLKTSEYGDTKDWVIVRETGEFTYLLPDIAYHKDRFNKKYDRIINIWGADHQGHVSKIKAVSKMLGYKGELVFLITQVVRLKGEKMSKRKGKVVTLEWLINEAGLDAVKFIYLMKSLDAQMEFDLDLAKKQSEKNPVYYVQYAHARICSILRKAKTPAFAKASVGKAKRKAKNYDLLNHPSELNLIKQLIRFPEIIEDTAEDYQVQRLPQYASDLATSFHQFYRDCRVLAEDRSLSGARLGLILATKIILKNALSLMGVSAPERM